MNYQNLEHEIKDYSNYFKYCDSITTKITQFFKEFTKNGSKFILRTKKLMEEIDLEINKEEYFSSTVNKNIINFSNEFKSMMDKILSFFTKIDNDIVEKINEFDKENKENIKNILNKFNNLNLLLIDNKTKVEKIKNIYFDSCKNMSDFEKKYLSNKNSKEEDLIKYKDQFEKLKQISESKKVNYRIEVTKLKDILVSNENYYLDLFNSITKQEEDRNQLYVKSLSLFNNIIKEFNLETQKSTKTNNNYIDEMYVKRDLKLFSIFFNRINNKDKNRFLIEEFLDFENFNETQNKNNSGEILKNKSNNENVNNIYDNDIKDIEKIDYKLASEIISLGENRFIEIETMDNEFIELDNIIFNLIKRDEKIDNEKFLRILNYVDRNLLGSKNFLYLLIGHYYNASIVNFNNLENLYLLCTILNMILNFIWDNDDYTYLSFLVLHIGEKTIYFNPSDKYSTYYLSKIMAKNTIYHMNEFWNKIINLKIKMFAKIKLKEEIYLRKKNNIPKKKTGSILKYFVGKDEGNEIIESEILYSQIYKDKSSFFCNEILTEYISHFMNYDFMDKNTIDVIEQLSKHYGLNTKQKNFFLEMLNSNIIYLQACNPYFSENKSDTIKYDNQEDLNKLYFSFDSNKKFKSAKNNTKIKIFLFAMKYLNTNDIISLLCLNKEFNSKIKKTVYKNVLMKYNNIDTKRHIGIWKLILNYNSIKKKYNYKSILDSIKKESNKDPIFDIIELDIIRTSFSKNQEENQNKLGNILKVTSKELPTVNYCQGMNHIAGSLLVLCDEDEEETFYLFLSLLFATDYCGLIVNDLLKLNSFFYCFERLLNIMYPEMNSYFKNINVNGGYFLSPWFITLFTNAFNDESGKDNIKIMLKILDLFLLSGWKAIFKIGIGLIKNNAFKIFSLPYEKLIHYLNNEIFHSDFFKNNNIKELMNISLNFKISNKLINSLCKEFELKKNIMNKKIN